MRPRPQCADAGGARTASIIATPSDATPEHISKFDDDRELGRLSNLPHYVLRRRDVFLGVELGHAKRLVTQDHLRCLQAVFPAEFRRGSVPQLMRVPAGVLSAT